MRTNPKVPFLPNAGQSRPRLRDVCAFRARELSGEATAFEYKAGEGQSCGHMERPWGEGRQPRLPCAPCILPDGKAPPLPTREGSGHS